MVRVAVLGAGVIGLSCAVRIKETFRDVEVVLIAKEFSPNTTGDGSAGFWYPYLCGDTPEDKLLKWGQETYQFLHKLWLEGVRGTCAMPVYLLEQSGQFAPEPCWQDFVFGFHVMDSRHLMYLSDLHSANYVSGFCFTTFIAEPTSLLPYLMARFTGAGGHVLGAVVTSLTCDSLCGCDVVVNCTGMGAGALVPDEKVFPIRGQVARVKAPWTYEIFIDHTGGNYIIPNVTTCVLGGTHQEHDYNTSIDPADSRFILQGCQKMIPSLQHAEVVSQWAGLRPGRETVRLESEADGGRLIIHNYGHGGSGVTLFWGCAGQVLEILRHTLGDDCQGSRKENVQSKL